MKLVDFIAALAQHIADERGWTLAEATRWVEVRLREARHSETDGVEDQATPQFAIQPLDEHYARLLLAIVAGDRLEALYRVALSLGLRRGEVLGLRWVDVDFEHATQRITGSLQRLRGKLERSSAKTAASAQPIALPPVLLAALRRHREAQAHERANVGERWHDSGLVFTTSVGTPIEPRNLIRHFKAVLKKAGLPQTIRFHDLRHSCATLLIAQGVHPRVVMEILRHSQISTTHLRACAPAPAKEPHDENRGITQ